MAKELTEEQIAAIKAIEAQVKLDVDALPQDANWRSAMLNLVKEAEVLKNGIKNPPPVQS